MVKNIVLRTERRKAVWAMRISEHTTDLKPPG